MVARRLRMISIGLAAAVLAAGTVHAEADPAGCTARRRERVTVCHRPPGAPSHHRTLTVGSRAVRAHLSHGDAIGACCFSDGDCPEGEICNTATGTCETPKDCTDDTDCPAGQFCDTVSGKCETSTTTTTMPPFSCADDAACADLTTTCAIGTCDPTTSTCIAIPRNNGAECDSTGTAPCSVGGICSDGHCIGLPLCDPQCSKCDAGTCASLCGNPFDGESTGITLADALFILSVSVDLEECAACVCDVDQSGAVTAVDALALLRVLVGLPETLACPANEEQPADEPPTAP